MYYAEENHSCNDKNNSNVPTVKHIPRFLFRFIKSVPLQAWSGPEGSRKVRFPDFMTTVQDSGKVVSLTHRPLLPP